MKKYYITTSIPYANAVPHMGHVMELLGTDVAARAKRLLGYDVYFQTGTDEHGQKMLEAAAKEGKTPRAYADEIVPRFLDLWRDLDISHDGFVRSTDDYHEKGVTKFWRAVRDHGDIYQGHYEGWYCVPEEKFFLESQVKLGPDGAKLCPECDRELTWSSEENYFFRLSSFQKAMEKWIEEHPDFIEPLFRRNEMVNSFLKPGLQDISISRSTIKWGISVPDDPKHVIYVWFDALLNYITGVGYGTDDARFAEWWPCDVHVVGKDILKFHTLLWPAMCIAAGVEPPRRVFCHGFILAAGDQKMSKSVGNVVDPRSVLDAFGGNPDPLRYFIMREIDFGHDGLYSNDALVARYNAELANTLGNLLARTLTMVEKYAGGQPRPPATYSGEDTSVIDMLMALFKPGAGGVTEYEQYVDDFNFNQLLQRVWAGISRLNVYITEQQPWALAKDPAKADRLGAVLYVLCEGLRVAATQIAPFIPRTAGKVWQQLGITEPMHAVPFERLRTWGFLDNVTVARGENLFPKIETDK